jgi:hypothetical protein
VTGRFIEAFRRSIILRKMSKTIPKDCLLLLELKRAGS